ncbi:hypothetical protein F5887DRAFT_31177 [Amanita rubescens]|nr:hypothetical protein F5887DRAFT_31177 [Amanita rubescens]
MILQVFWLALAVVPAVVAQFANCTSSNFTWAFNSLGQGPCEVASDLTVSCPPGYPFGPLSPGQLYTPEETNNCTCNTIRYSLVSVCAACQDGSWLPFSTYTQNCTYRFVQQFPEPVPNGTSVPNWAYLPLSANGTFDIDAASRAAESTSTALPTATSTSASQVASTSSPKTSSLSSSTSPSSTPKIAKTDISAIAGGTVAGVLGGALIGGLLFWIWIYRKRKAARRNVLIWSGRGILASPSVSSYPASMQRLVVYQAQKLYNPDDPSTYPPTRHQLTQMNLLPPPTTESTELPPYDFTGRPEL